MEKRVTLTKEQLFKVIQLNEQENKKETVDDVVEDGNIVDMISILLHSRSQAHIFHWQTKSQSSFAEHMALGGYYEEIGELIEKCEEFHNHIHSCFETLENIQSFFLLNNNINVTHNNWTGDFNELLQLIVDLRSTLNELPSANPTLPRIGEFSRSLRERDHEVNFRDRFHADEQGR